MAEQLLTMFSYFPTAAHDMYAFGLLLLELLGGEQPVEYEEALVASQSGDPRATLKYARGLYHLPADQAYNIQVSYSYSYYDAQLLQYYMAYIPLLIMLHHAFQVCCDAYGVPVMKRLFLLQIDLPDLGEYDQPLRQIVLGCLETDPVKRMTAEAALNIMHNLILERKWEYVRTRA